MLRALFSIIAKDGATAPEWMLLFAAGAGEVEGDGRFLVDEESYQAVAGRFARRGNDLVIDYEHQTIEGAKAPAAGWIKELKWDPAQGILARVEWTAEAAEYIAKGEYRYFSPVFYTRKTDGRVVGVHSVALTNAPKTNHLKPILAKLGAAKEEESMDWFKKLFAALGLAEGATGDEVLTAVAKLKDKPEEGGEAVVAKEILEALGEAEGADLSAVVASIHALKQQPQGMVSREEFDKLQAVIAKKQASDAVAAALAAGKVTPDQREWATNYATNDPKGFETFVAKAPVVVPLGQLPGKSPEVDKAKADEATLRVAKMMGVPKEDLDKFGGEDDEAA